MHNYNDSLKLVMHSSPAAKCIYMPYYTSHKVSSTEQKPQNLDLIFVMHLIPMITYLVGESLFRLGSRVSANELKARLHYVYLM